MKKIVNYFEFLKLQREFIQAVVFSCELLNIIWKQKN